MNLEYSELELIVKILSNHINKSKKGFSGDEFFEFILHMHPLDMGNDVYFTTDKNEYHETVIRKSFRANQNTRKQFVAVPSLGRSFLIKSNKFL